MNDLKSSGAIFSKDKMYRYVLWRIWDPKKQLINIIGLNPSTADEKTNDPTMRRCTSFTHAWGYGGFYMTNLFAYRTPHPKELFNASKPIGKENDKWIKEVSSKVDRVVLAWGAKGHILNRDKAVRDLIDKSCYCLAYTKAGQPKHPLYIRSGTPLIKYEKKT